MSHPQDHEHALGQLIDQHFAQAQERVDDVYEVHFKSAKAIFKRHWRYKKDIPGDLLLLPRALFSIVRRNHGRSETLSSGKERAIRRIVENELLELPELEAKLEQYCQQVLTEYQRSLPQLDHLTERQREHIRSSIDFKLKQLHQPGEGLREALLAVTLMATGKALGDKALLSSAASVGSTVASSWYMAQQSWFGALWASWFGLPGWVSVAGVGGGVVLIIGLTPLLSPWTEWTMNRLRAKKLLNKTVADAHKNIKERDGVLLASRVGQYLQFLPDLAQSISKML